MRVECTVYSILQGVWRWLKSEKKNMHGKIETEYFNTLYNNTVTKSITQVVVAEWLRRWTRNPLGSPRAGSNPADYEERVSILALHRDCVFVIW